MPLVLGAILAGDRVNGACAGVLVAVAMTARWRRTLRAKLRAQSPARVSHWESLSRSERRHLKAIIRRGGAVPAQHAALLREQIEVIDQLWQAHNLRRGRRLLKSLAGVSATLGVGALLAFTGHPDRVSTVIGFSAFGYGTTVGLILLYAVLSHQRWARWWPDRVAALRAETNDVEYTPGPPPSLSPPV